MHILTKDLPEDEKPYEKCMRHGPQALSDAELLAVIIRTGTSGLSGIELAREILSLRGGNLLNLYHLSISELRRLPGIGMVKAVQLKCIGEISKRIAMETTGHLVTMNHPQAIAAYYKEQLRHNDRECLLVSMYDSKCHLLGDEIISVGTVNSSLVSPREIFRKALEYQAVHIVLLHNHPSGVAAPSRQDELVTQQIGHCGELLGIRLADHIIIGDNQYYSFKEQGKI